MLFLQYGVNKHGELVSIDQVPSGQTALGCPYCGGSLIARKGEKLAHHFAHHDETCNPASRDPAEIALPAYDNFNLHLPGRAVKALLTWSENASASDETYLEGYQLLEWNTHKGRSGGYQLTKKGKVVLGELSLDLFNQFQEPLILARHTELEAKARKAQGTVDFNTALTDLRLYRAQMRRILACTLYFLKVGDDHLYKIGVTTREVNERVAEIAADVRPHLGDTSITVIDTWPSRGNVEFYFKHRYRKQQKSLGTLTEYFTFEDMAAVLRDLHRMKAKGFVDFEQRLLAGKPSDLEAELEAERIEVKRRAAISQGLRRAVDKGKAVGRPKGSETSEQVLAKPYAVAVQAALKAGYSLRDAAQIAQVSLSTVQKVKAALTDEPILSTPKVFTLADLPITDDPQVLFDFCERQAEKLRWREWAGGKCREIPGEGFFFYAENYDDIFYLGKTWDELRETLLAWLNTGKDHRLRRLRLTAGERRLLVRFKDQRFLSNQWVGRERSIVKGLLRKHLVNVPHGSVLCELTSEGRLALAQLVKRAQPAPES